MKPQEIPSERNCPFKLHIDTHQHGEPRHCVVLQLQKLFANLSLSQKVAVDTINLTKVCYNVALLQIEIYWNNTKPYSNIAGKITQSCAIVNRLLCC